MAPVKTFVSWAVGGAGAGAAAVDGEEDWLPSCTDASENFPWWGWGWGRAVELMTSIRNDRL